MVPVARGPSDINSLGPCSLYNDFIIKFGYYLNNKNVICLTNYLGDGCVWKGTSPFCDGGCNVKGHVVRDTSTTGDGERCLTGIKVLCCPSALPGL